ncbi:MAG: Gfo/Idh/MocA family oxidoreductase [Thermoguttaceae bacterium]
MIDRTRFSRRALLGRMAATAGSAVAIPYLIPSEILSAQGRPGANDRVQIGVIGAGLRGKYLISNVPDEGRVAAICDFSNDRIAATLKLDSSGKHAFPPNRFRERDAARCATYQDYRRLIDEVALDAVMIATPDHHHILAAMLACQAGLDIYVEKPLSVAIAEGRALVNAVGRHRRVCQVGSQQRSMEMNRFACQAVREGLLGKISHVQVLNYPGPMRYEGLPEEPVPEGHAWDLFCGPTPLRPYNRKLWVKDVFKIDGRSWRGWDLWRSYSGHLMTNHGAHGLDQVQWALGMDHTGPVEIWPLTEDYQGEMRFCPVVARYANGIELRFDASTGVSGVGGLVHGEHGRMAIMRNGFRADPADLVTDPPDPAAAEVWQGVGIVARPHIQNWLDCIKTRGTPNAPIEVGHRSVTVCHLAGIARELGRKLRWDPAKEIFPDDAEANALRDRPRRAGFELPVDV